MSKTAPNLERERKPILGIRVDPEKAAADFEAWLFTERNRFCIERARRGQRNAPVSISKAEADRRLKAALAILATGGARA